ncbi:glycosyltransferase [Nodosilinea sp. FACHB-131]|uniref:glycosyltransferase family 2 protein n=1 Tax=Cyanophyceae TaxID=3028117 RepID=UPI00168891BF|nr:glycosyltransferase [Nodosilinea sp. FACHB-131]MBD1872382.1 glycosyltransferase [Nodosilinea sp. FACHB-131]
MKFSLILATLGRTFQVKTFLESLDQQSYRDFELIVVDQNSDDRLLSLLTPYKNHFSILHLRSKKGLSLARNVALKQISGDLVAFPDDDCAYTPDLLEEVAHFFKEQPELSGLVGRAVNQQGNDSSGRWDHVAGTVNAFNVWRRGTSFTIFLRRAVVDAIGPFDETLGVGASTPWGSGEDIDYLLRAVSAGLYYDPSFLVIHPTKVEALESVQSLEAIQPKTPHAKTYFYAMGRGRVLRKHNAPFWFLLYNWFRPCTGIILSLLQGKIDRVKSHWATLKGRVQGWLGWA